MKNTTDTNIPQLECIFQLLELVNKNINIKTKQNKNVISNILRPYSNLTMLLNYSQYVIIQKEDISETYNFFTKN